MTYDRVYPFKSELSMFRQIELVAIFESHRNLRVAQILQDDADDVFSPRHSEAIEAVTDQNVSTL